VLWNVQGQSSLFLWFDIIYLSLSIYYGIIEIRRVSTSTTMLLSAECIVEVVKHMLSSKEREMLRQTCKAFRNVMTKTDLFHKAYFKFLKSNNLSLSRMNGELIVKCDMELSQNKRYKFMQNQFVDFVEAVRGIYFDELNPNSILVVRNISKSIHTSIKAVHDDTTSDYERRRSCGGYVLGSKKVTIHLISLEEILETSAQVIVSLPNRIPLFDGEGASDHIFDYIEYPKLILSPSDT